MLEKRGQGVGVGNGLGFEKGGWMWRVRFK